MTLREHVVRWTRPALALASIIAIVAVAVVARNVQVPTASASSAARGITPRTASSRWRLVFGDSFLERIPLGRFPRDDMHKWGGTYPDGTPDTSRAGTYMPSSVVSVAHGVLTMHLRTVNGRHLVAAIIPTIRGAHAGHGLLYGRVVIRMRADSLAGYKLAVFLWPDNNSWPGAGEIDFPETDLNGAMFAYMHRSGAQTGTDANRFSTGTGLRSWHTTSITWLRGSVTFQLDGHTIGQVRHRIPATPMHLVIQAETSTTGSPPGATTSGNVQFASVSIYTPSCNPRMSITPRFAACAG
jgi:hypothetical protein